MKWFRSKGTDAKGLLCGLLCGAVGCALPRLLGDGCRKGRAAARGASRYCRAQGHRRPALYGSPRTQRHPGSTVASAPWRWCALAHADSMRGHWAVAAFDPGVFAPANTPRRTPDVAPSFRMLLRPLVRWSIW